MKCNLEKSVKKVNSQNKLKVEDKTMTTKFKNNVRPAL